MQNPTALIDELEQRIEFLLQRLTQAEQHNLALQDQLQLLSKERDSLQSRLQAARSRIDALLDRLPVNPQ